MLKSCWYALLLVVIVELQPILFLCAVLRKPFFIAIAVSMKVLGQELPPVRLDYTVC